MHFFNARIPLGKFLFIEQEMSQQKQTIQRNTISVRCYRVNEQFGTVEADTAEYFDCLGQKSNMEHGFGELNVTEMARTGGHVASTRLTLCGPLDYPLSGIHETTQLGPTTLHGIRVVNPIWECHRHAFLEE